MSRPNRSSDRLDRCARRPLRSRFFQGAFQKVCPGGWDDLSIKRFRARAGMTSKPKVWPRSQNTVGVIQPLPGIGDMVWHLPHIRAIAAHAGQPVTLMTKPRTLADQLLAHEPSIAQ